jgi:hypothetical protein
VTGTTFNSPAQGSPTGPSFVTVSRLTAAVHVGLVLALILLVILHSVGFHFAVVVETGLVAIVVAAALLVGWPRHKDTEA